MKKPPLGLLPMKLYWEYNFDDPTSISRLNEVNSAIERYNEYGKEIPFEWQAEKYFLDTIHTASVKDKL